MRYRVRRNFISAVRFIVGFLYIILGKPFLTRGITAFVFHEVSDHPNAHARETNTFSSLIVFERQIEWIRSSFPVIDLGVSLDLPRDGGCIVSFDDGYLGVLESALPILEKHQVAATCFINMATILGEVNSSALAKFMANGRDEEVDWRDSNPQFLSSALASLSETELQTLKDYQGPYLSMEELALLSQSPQIVIGDHLYNHWFMDALSESEFARELSKGQVAMRGTEVIDSLFASPHGVASTEKLEFLAKGGYRLVFSGSRQVQVDSLRAFPRIDMNNGIRNKCQFLGVIVLSRARSKYLSR